MIKRFTEQLSLAVGAGCLVASILSIGTAVPYCVTATIAFNVVNSHS